ncbi:transposase [Streptomyces sp. NPDC001817]|uniref:IS110 family transposase n=1 Tax=Streptomyces sp. NPDC001817 TaxID=3154398 RepID=UPI003320CBA1
MSVYVGIDVHRKRSQAAVIDQDGSVQVNRNVPNGMHPILGMIGDLPIGAPVAFEAAFGWGWLVEMLEDYGFEPHLVHPSRCKAIASARLKNDKVDAATLAQLLRADLLPEAWIPRCPCGSKGRCCAIASTWCGCAPCCATGSTLSWPNTVWSGPGPASPPRGGPGSGAWTCRTPHARLSISYSPSWTRSRNRSMPWLITRAYHALREVDSRRPGRHR